MISYPVSPSLFQYPSTSLPFPFIPSFIASHHSVDSGTLSPRVMCLFWSILWNLLHVTDFQSLLMSNCFSICLSLGFSSLILTLEVNSLWSLQMSAPQWTLTQIPPAWSYSQVINLGNSLMIIGDPDDFVDVLILEQSWPIFKLFIAKNWIKWSPLLVCFP